MNYAECEDRHTALSMCETKCFGAKKKKSEEITQRSNNIIESAYFLSSSRRCTNKTSKTRSVAANYIKTEFRSW